MKLDEHLARHRLADLCLDTLPHSAHTTATRIRKQTESGSLGPWEDLAEVRDHQEHTSPATWANYKWSPNRDKQIKLPR